MCSPPLSRLRLEKAWLESPLVFIDEGNSHQRPPERSGSGLVHPQKVMTMPDTYLCDENLKVVFSNLVFKGTGSQAEFISIGPLQATICD